MRTTSTILLLAAAIASSALCDDGDFQWQGQLAPAQLLEIRGALGSIRAEGTSDGTASVTARKTATAGDPATVSIQVTPSEGGVVICAMYPDGNASKPNTCNAPGMDSYSSIDNNTDVQVDGRRRPIVTAVHAERKHCPAPRRGRRSVETTYRRACGRASIRIG